MEERFNAKIDANIKSFQRKMQEVDQIIRRAAMGAEIEVEADIGEFLAEMATVNEIIDDVAQRHNVDIDAVTSGFTAEAERVQETIDEIARANPTVTVDASTRTFTRRMAQVQAVASRIGSQQPTVTVDADTAPAMTRIQLFMARVRALTMNDFTVKIKARWKNYQNVMGAIASFSRAFGEVTAMTARGIMISISPAIVPILASVVGLLGNLGPMLGVIGGSTFALGTAFATAGIGAAGFGAIAVTNLKDIFDVNEKLKKQQENLAKADTSKERAKILKEITRLQGTLNKEQQKGLEAMGKLKKTWSGIAESLQTETIQIFTKTLEILSGVLKTLKPMFKGVTESVGNLIDSLGKSINAKPMQTFFDYLNKTAGPTLETITKAAGNLIQGFFNMMVAFGPLATETSNGFLKMSESFATWSANLGKSEKFQAFVDYVSENMPKIRKIFGDAFKGIINTFAAFAPSSSTMMTSLQDMMARFREWSSKLGENEGFKKFVDYFMTNGPKVLTAIGNITTFIINLGKALAPAGAIILGFISSIVNFTNKLMEAHPWLGKVIAAVVVFGGMFLAALPNIILLNAALNGLIFKMVAFVAKQVWAAAVSVAKWIWMATQATLSAIKQAAAWTLATGIAMVTALAKMAASAAIFVAKWVLMGAQALLHAAKVAAAWLLTTGVGMVTALASMVATSAIFVAKWVWMGVQALAQAARMAAAWFIALGPIGWVTGAIIALAVLIIANWDKISAWTSKTWTQISTWISEKWAQIKAKTIEAATSVWTTIKEKFTSIVSSVREKMESAKSTISDKWESIKSAASSKLATLVVTVAKFFTDLVSKVREKMTEAVNKVKEKVAEMPGKVTSYVGKMLSAGKDLIKGLIDGAVSMAGDAISSIKKIAGDMVDAALSFFKIKSPSRVFREIGGFVSEGLAIGVDNKAKMAVSAVSGMATAMTRAFQPEMQMAGVSVGAASMDVGPHMDGLHQQIKRELEVSMDVNHSGSVGSGASGGNTYYVTIDAKNVREFNDVISAVEGLGMSVRKG